MDMKFQPSPSVARALGPDFELFGHKRHDPRVALAKVQGLQLHGGHAGALVFGRQSAHVELDPCGDIRVTWASPPPLAPPMALAASHRLPGNLRYATDKERPALVADAQMDGELHLARTFQLIRRGFQAASRASRAMVDDSADRSAQDEPATLPGAQRVLDQLDWPREAVVAQETGWELRPRIRGEAVPVQVRLDDRDLHLSRPVLRRLPTEQRYGKVAVADQALRFNFELRHARLALAGDTVVAEARLHGGLMQPHWLATAAYAVAVAGQYCEPAIRLLAEDAELAESYCAMFGSAGEHPPSLDRDF